MDFAGSSDAQNRQQSAHALWRREHYQRPPRLLTPEASRSSNGSVDEQSPRDFGKAGPHISALLQRESSRHTKASPESMLGDVPSMRKDSRNSSAPHSPPYRANDARRPLLPPLKTVLGDSINSPPGTPRVQESGLQPCPREPALYQSTFKPPALYPNKKLRTDRISEYSPTLHSSSTLSSPGQQPMCFPRDFRSSGAHPASNGREQAPERPVYDYQRRSSYQPTQSSPFAENGCYRPTAAYQGTATRVPDERVMGIESTGPERARLPQLEPSYLYSQEPTRTSLPGTAPRPADRYQSQGGQYASRRSSIYNAAPSQQTNTAEMRPPFGDHPRYPLPSRDEFLGARERNRYESQAQESVPAMTDYRRGSFQESQPSFFMPSQFDYSQGKTRKRSNLPKQSTEIMKTWFDQNIQNPYPSEEQKAIFSNATGISMTQVSNWFINHRRRCPELRDKRERLRTGPGDVSD